MWKGLEYIHCSFYWFFPHLSACFPEFKNCRLLLSILRIFMCMQLYSYWLINIYEYLYTYVLSKFNNTTLDLEYYSKHICKNLHYLYSFRFYCCIMFWGFYFFIFVCFSLLLMFCLFWFGFLSLLFDRNLGSFQSFIYLYTHLSTLGFDKYMQAFQLSLNYWWN